MGATRAAQRVRQCKFGGASRPWLPLWGSWRAISEPERAFAVANMEKVRRLRLGTLSVTAFSRDSSPIGRAKGRASPAQSRPAQSAEPGDPQRCGSIARAAGSNCQRGHPAVLTFCRPSPARLPIYRQCTPPRLPGRWGSGWGSGATCGSRSLWLSGGRCPGRSGRSGRPGRRG